MYIITRWIIFKGFNGTDDLHYAMLAANLLKGTYNPFMGGDIFSGRVLLIAWQALFYRMGGINVLTTQAPAILAVLLSCWLTTFKLLRAATGNAVLIITSLFYFNPVLTYATDGILPDVYVMLAGIITLLLWNRSIAAGSTRKNILNGAGMAITITACFFFKETVIVFPVLIACLTLLQRSKAAVITCTAMLAVLLAAATTAGTVYHHFTGNVFYRLQQVSDSSYYNPCSYDILPASFLVIRLTYGVWKLFLVNGFYPVIFATGIICSMPFSGRKNNLFQNSAITSFLLLLIIALYLPFSLTSYQPLCSDSSRHFLFLLPFGVWVCAPYLIKSIGKNKSTIWLVICCASLALCIAATPDKWQWMVWVLLIVFFLMQKLFIYAFLVDLKPVAFAAIIWLCMPYRLFYNNSGWFTNMQQLNKQLTGNLYYFPDHDNMMHWKLLHSFNDTIHCYNLAPAPYKVFARYYDTTGSHTFHPGWLLINKKYTERTEHFLFATDSLQSLHYFSKQVNVGDMEAFYINNTATLIQIKNLAANDEKVIK